MKAKRNQEFNVSIAIEAADTYRVCEHDAFTGIHRSYACSSDYIEERFGSMMLPYLLTPANGRKDVLFTITWG